MLRWYGDYIVAISLTLNTLACLAYLWEGVWLKATYWAGAMLINAALLGLRH